MPRYGYARVSTLDQDLSIQRAALKAAGCEGDPGRDGERRPPRRAHRIAGAARLARRRITYLLRGALGDLFLGPYAGFEAPPDLVRAAFSAGTTRNL